MNLRLELKDDKYAVITKGVDYGYIMNIYTPVDEKVKRVKNTSNTHTKGHNLFFHKIEHLINHLIWDGLDGSDLEQLLTSMKTTRDIICKQLKQSEVL